MRRAVIVIAILAGVGLIIVLRLSGTGSRDTGTTDERAASARVKGKIGRPPAVAGLFYPADASGLRAQVNACLEQPKGASPPGEPVALIVPHAGYTYSAGVAGHAYRQIRGKHFDTVVVIGPSHRMSFRGVALSGADFWDTPLGQVPVDRAATEALAKADRDAEVLDEAHLGEHSVEVQLPFLQTVLKDFQLLPLLMSDFSESNCSALAKALAEWARGRSVLLVASTDMSHYPAYDEAVRVDKEVLKAIEAMDANAVAATCRKLVGAGTPGLATCLCGEGPVKAVLMAARLLGADEAKVLHYANSGDIAGSPRDRVVGYCAVALYRKSSARASPRSQGTDLSPPQQQRLLSLARATVEEYVTTGRSPEVHETDPALLRPAAVFVTLKQHGVLRGCIGSLEPEGPLSEAVRDKAIAAATQDPRFSPVRAGELADLEIEISVLSPLEQVKSADEIKLGTHGVVVAAGPRRGVFLPQVAGETGWTREEFLEHLCRDKAGLPADSWKRGATLYVFTVQSFASPAPREQPHGTRSGE